MGLLENSAHFTRKLSLLLFNMYVKKWIVSERQSGYFRISQSNNIQHIPIRIS
jgi:hypothetical protein